MFPLLELPVEVTKRLLPFVASGEGGPTAILHLRRVCRATKKWVDEHSEANELFTNITARVEVEGRKDEALEVIRKFLQTPPPLHVTSLFLRKVESVAVHLLSPAEEELWERFVLFWWGRLEALCVDSVDNLLHPMDSRVSQLLSSSRLRSLTCEDLIECENPLELPQCLFYMEHLRITDTFDLSHLQKTRFFEALARAPRLKRFEVVLWDFTDIHQLQQMTKFVISTQKRGNLEVVISVDDSPSDKRKETQEFQEALSSFVTAVAATEASFQISKVDWKLLFNLERLVGKQIAAEFSKSVVGIFGFNSTSSDILLQFPNLTKLDCFQSSLSEEGDFSFPPGILDFRVKSGLPCNLYHCRNLPAGLTRLEIDEHCFSVCELRDTLASLDRRCPFLKSFSLDWKGDGSLEMFCSYPQSQPKVADGTETPFKNLRHFRFTLDAIFGDNPNSRAPSNLDGARWILLNGMKLPQLSLLQLKLEFAPKLVSRNTPPPILDRFALKSLLKGVVATSLVSVDFGASFVSRDAASAALEKTFLSKVGENAERWLKVIRKPFKSPY